MDELQVINLFGEPGCGKSVTAADLYVQMRRAGHDVGLIITKYDNESVWGHQAEFDELIEIFDEHERKLDNLRGKVKMVITDNPLLLGLLHCPEERYASYDLLVWEVFNSYQNHNFVLECEGIPKTNMVDILDDNRVPYNSVNVDDTTVPMIISKIFWINRVYNYRGPDDITNKK